MFVKKVDKKIELVLCCQLFFVIELKAIFILLFKKIETLIESLLLRNCVFNALLLL
jgi:hypothetical protein